eukprot:1120302_1
MLSLTLMSTNVLFISVVLSFAIGIRLGIETRDFENAYAKASAEFEKYFKEQWMEQTLKYEGHDIKVQLTISDQVFQTSANVLFHQKHGVTLFIHEFLGTDKNSINYECNGQEDDVRLNADQGKVFKFDEAIHNKMDAVCKRTDKTIELYFDRDPHLFSYILNYLRGYPIQSELFELNVRWLEKLLADAKYFKLTDLHTLVKDTLHSRFNPYLCTPPPSAEITDSGRTWRRIIGGNHRTCSVYGVLKTGRRYVEFDCHCVTHGNRYFMIGVTEAGHFKSGTYPGHPNTKGISLYGNNGHLYRNGGKEGWSPSFHHGDRVGVLVDINEDKKDAKIIWYINGKKIKHALDLAQYMNIDNGVLFTVNMQHANEQVQIIQYPEMPILTTLFVFNT